METRPGTGRDPGYDPASAAPAEKASVVEDFIDIFHSPSAVFARRASGGYGLQLLIVTLLSAAFTFANRGLISQIMSADFDRRAAKMMAENPQLTQDMLNQGRGIQEAFAMAFGYIGTPIFIFVVAFFIWLAGKIFGAKVTYGQAAMITTLAWIPRLVGTLVATVMALVTDTSNFTSFYQLSMSPARFMDPDTTNPKLLAFMGNLDVFAIWFWILVAIGVAVVARVPRGKGFAVAGALFILGSLPALFA